MLKVSNSEVFNFNNAIRGMRNPLNSWDKSDSKYCYNDTAYDCYTCAFGKNDCDCNNQLDGFILGKNDLELAKKLVKAGSDERKFLRQIFISVDIYAPLYWFKEMDTYKVATVSNSCSTMHKIHEKKFTLDDFSHEHLDNSVDALDTVIAYLNVARDNYIFYKNELLKDIDQDERLRLQSEKKKNWWQMIQLLPSSYNQLRTWTANYETLRNIYHARKNHKLDEWKQFCAWIETLPYAKELIIS